MRDLSVLDDTNFNKSDVGNFLSLLFKDSDNIDIVVDNIVLILDITTSMGRKVKKANLPVNIKNNDILGWYCEDYDLCLLPLRNGKFMLKQSCGKNKHIRSLRADFTK